MHKMAISTVLILVLVVVASARVISSKVDNKAKEIYDNQIEIRKQFKCGPPQPRIIYVDEIIKERDWNEEYKNISKDKIRPFGVVLHRCENSGCCNSNQERCKALSEEPVTLSFFMIMNDGKKEIPTYRTYTGTNHTMCSCQSTTKQIK